MPAAFAVSSTIMFIIPPGAGPPTFSLPGFFFAWATSSCQLLKGASALVSSMPQGKCPVSPRIVVLCQYFSSTTPE